MRKLNKYNKSLEFLLLLQAVYNHSVNELDRICSSMNITHQQAAILGVLSRNEKMTVNELSETLHLTRGTVSGTVKRLAFKGFVTKTKGRKDNRETYVQIKEKYLEMANRIFSELDSSLYRKVLDAQYMDPEEMLKIRHIFEKITE